MKNLLEESGTASQAFGCVSMTKTKPITALYQCQFRGTGVAGRKPTKTLPIRPISVRYHTLIPKI